MIPRRGPPPLRAAGLLSMASAIAGCGVRHVPPPAPPPQEIPYIVEGPDQPPPEGLGRLLIENEHEPAKVSRITETLSGVPITPAGQTNPVQVDVESHSTPQQKSVLLCITPCAADLSIGAHTLVFASMNDPQKTSTADVRVPRGTTVVRHDLGYVKPYSGAYVGGLIAVLSGSGLALIGGLGLTVGLVAKPTVDDDGNKSDPRGFVAFGAVLGTVGIAALVSGILLMTSNRPEKRPGATTTFRVAN
jgi:hypothetical protein